MAEQQWDAFSLFVIDIFAPLARSFGSLSILGEYTHLKFLGNADPFLTPFAQSAGFDLSVFKFLIALFVAYPFSALLYHLPSATAKHLCSFVIGFIFVQWIFAADWIHTFISSIGTYLICALLPKRYIGVAGFVWVMGYLMVCHIFSMQMKYMNEEFDFLRTQMVITMKLTSFAYNLYDGTYDYKKVFATDHNPKEAKMYAQRKKFAITSLPSLLEFLGYVYCFPCILVGPAFEYNDYIRPINGDAFLLPPPVTSSEGGQGREKTVKRPSTFLPALQRLATGVFFMGLYLYFIPSYDIASHYKPDFIAATSPLHRFVLLQLSLLVQRFKFYFAWKVAEGGSILGGFGFEGYDVEGREKGWKGAENVDIIGVETCTNVQSMTRHWNKRTQGWLERYTYMRTGRSLVAIYTVSAMWHGLYPGYFFAFLTVPLPTNIERLFKVKINPLIVPGYNGYDQKTYPKTIIARVYEVVCWVGTWSAMAYSMQVFYMISMERSMNAWKGYYFIGHVIMMVVFVVLSVLPTPRISNNNSSERKKEKGDSTSPDSSSTTTTSSSTKSMDSGLSSERSDKKQD